jgi:hypothetical protein
MTARSRVRTEGSVSRVPPRSPAAPRVCTLAVASLAGGLLAGCSSGHAPEVPKPLPGASSSSSSTNAAIRLQTLHYPAAFTALPAATRRVPVAYFHRHGTSAAGIAISGKAVWVVSGDSGAVVRIDPSSDAVSATLDYSGLDTVAASGRAVWASSYRLSEAFRLDYATGRVLKTVAGGPGDHDVLRIPL